ncbi:MAG: hypothetical protein HYX47_22825 [Burkholderiales bacterium]|nr:hypothetical protein [Burkholderiales bacterium]
MAKSSLMGGERAAVQPSGKGADLLGPSDSSDSGSDAMGELGPDQLNSDSDRSGTGERASADPRDSGEGADILPDRVDRVGGRNGSDRMGDDLAADTDEDSEEDAA